VSKTLTKHPDGTRLLIRVDFGPNRALGPGKIRLLEAIDKSGSISQAGRALGMSYRRAWLLVDDLNRCFREPVVSAQTGGSRGGGAVLTQFGRKLVRDFRAMETDAMVAARSRLRNLTASLRHSARAPSDKVRRLPVRRAGKR